MTDFDNYLRNLTPDQQAELNRRLARQVGKHMVVMALIKVGVLVGTRVLAKQLIKRL